MNRWYVLVFLAVLALPCPARAEDIRVLMTGTLEISLDNPAGSSIPLSYTDSIVLILGSGLRFWKAVELEFTVPQSYLYYRGSLAIALYTELDRRPEPGINDIRARQIYLEPVPHKIQSVFQIPLRAGHGLRTTPYVSVLPSPVAPASFPLLFRLMPIVKGLNQEVETMRFTLHVKPILGEEGAVKINIKYPDQLPDRPVTVLIDDEVIARPGDERLIREGEHHLVILSNDYRNESRRFLIERGKVLDLSIQLQDPTPLIIFEGPENSLLYFDNQLIDPSAGPLAAEPGFHEIRFQISDYSVIKTLTVKKGKTYRVALAVDVNISESE